MLKKTQLNKKNNSEIIFDEWIKTYFESKEGKSKIKRINSLLNKKI